jgi:SAM-dependent methyltransferase
LGNYIEIGCGPFTQTQFIVKQKTFTKISLLDPGIDSYITTVPKCSYKNGTLFEKEVRFLKYGNEKLMHDKDYGKFDTLMSINVIEHVWDAFQFLENIYHALKPGGIIIYHDRFYPTPMYGDKVLGHPIAHPIRIKKVVFDHFFKHFQTIYMFEGQTQEQIKRKAGEVG